MASRKCDSCGADAPLVKRTAAQVRMMLEAHQYDIDNNPVDPNEFVIGVHRAPCGAICLYASGVEVPGQASLFAEAASLPDDHKHHKISNIDVRCPNGCPNITKEASEADYTARYVEIRRRNDKKRAMGDVWCKCMGIAWNTQKISIDLDATQVWNRMQALLDGAIEDLTDADKAALKVASEWSERE